MISELASETEAAIEEAQRLSGTLDRDRAGFESSIDSAQSQISALEQELDTTKGTAASLRAEVKGLNGEVSRKTKALTALEAKLGAMGQKEGRTRSKEEDELRAQLALANDERESLLRELKEQELAHGEKMAELRSDSAARIASKQLLMASRTSGKVKLLEKENAELKTKVRPHPQGPMAPLPWGAHAAHTLQLAAALDEVEFMRQNWTDGQREPTPRAFEGVSDDLDEANKALVELGKALESEKRRRADVGPSQPLAHPGGPSRPPAGAIG